MDLKAEEVHQRFITDLGAEEADNLCKELKDWSVSNGIVFRSKNDPTLFHHVPFTMFPTPFPKKLFEVAMQAQTSFHTILYQLSKHPDFITDNLSQTIENDEFTARLYNIYHRVRKEGDQQPITFSITRSDYMVDDQRQLGQKDHLPSQLCQIEINTISASFGAHGTLLPLLHRHVGELMFPQENLEMDRVPSNSAVQGLGASIAQAWELYGNKSADIVFVVQPGERNSMDQRKLQYVVEQVLVGRGKAKVHLRTLLELHLEASLGQKNELMLRNKEVAVVYYRSGYGPGDYPTEAEWEARFLIEKSRAIKCPNIAYHLLGSKKIQQVLAKPGLLEQYVDDKDAISSARTTFGELLSLDPGEEGDATVVKVLADPDKYVLKPQREGGGHNFFGKDIPAVLEKLKDSPERSQFIVMGLAHPTVYRNFIVLADHASPVLADCVSELGIFGAFLHDGQSVQLSRELGYLYRTKSIEHKDGGVASGRAVLDSPYLI